MAEPAKKYPAEQRTQSPQDTVGSREAAAQRWLEDVLEDDDVWEALNSLHKASADRAKG